MKIDIAVVPNIMETMQELRDAQLLVAEVEAMQPDTQIVVAIDNDKSRPARLFKLSREELLAAYTARVDLHVKTLNSKYYIDLKRPTDSSPVIAQPSAASTATPETDA